MQRQQPLTLLQMLINITINYIKPLTNGFFYARIASAIW